MINVLVVDDHKLIRQGLIELIGKTKEYRVVAEAGDGIKAIELLKKHKPQIMLLDINMPLLDGIETLKQIRAMGIKVKVIIITGFPSRENIIQIVKYGANACVTKDSDFKDILKIIKDVNNNKKSIDQSLSKLIYENKHIDIDLEDVDIWKIDLLSLREYEILKLIALGDSNIKISSKLYISEKTVKNHITSIYSKIEVVNRVEAVIFCYKNKII